MAGWAVHLSGAPGWEDVCGGATLWFPGNQEVSIVSSQPLPAAAASRAALAQLPPPERWERPPHLSPLVTRCHLLLPAPPTARHTMSRARRTCERRLPQPGPALSHVDSDTYSPRPPRGGGGFPAPSAHLVRGF